MLEYFYLRYYSEIKGRRYSPKSSNQNIALYCIFQGATIGLIGVTMIDMRTRLNTSYDHLSDVIMCRHAASLFGTFLGGFISNRLRMNLDWCLTGISLGMVISLLGISIVRNLYAMAAFYVLSGICTGVAYIGNNLFYFYF